MSSSVKVAKNPQPKFGDRLSPDVLGKHYFKPLEDSIASSEGSIDLQVNRIEIKNDINRSIQPIDESEDLSFEDLDEQVRNI